jgi:2-(1,2-epoxy-1,2-dihydrophenyl)acetyl-CoA isomerase
MNNFSHLSLAINNSIGTITLQRADKYNALNPLLCQEIVLAIQTLEINKEIKMIVLQGEGKGFCAGLDLTEIELEALKDAEQVVRNLFNPIVNAMTNSTKTFICMLTGVAAGAGCSIALACDVIIAEENAILSFPFMKIKLLPDTGASYFLTQQVGYAKAFHFFTNNSQVTASEALQLGLITHVVPKENMHLKLEETCRQLSHYSLEHLSMLKKLLRLASKASFSETLENEALLQGLAAKDPAFLEAITAFKKK